MSKEQIAQWVIDNRFPKSEKEKISDFEIYNFLIDEIQAYADEANQKYVNLLNESRNLHVVCSLIDRSGQCNDMANKIEQTLKQLDHE